MLGVKFWELLDDSSEKANWRLISRSVDIYDGKEAVRAPGKDPWGFGTAGKSRTTAISSRRCITPTVESRNGWRATSSRDRKTIREQ